MLNFLQGLGIARVAHPTSCATRWSPLFENIPLNQGRLLLSCCMHPRAIHALTNKCSLSCCMRLAGHTSTGKDSSLFYAVCAPRAIHAPALSCMLYAPRRPYMHRQVRSVLSCYMRFSSHVRMTKFIISLFAVYALRTIPASMGSTRTTLPSHGSRSHFVRPV